ncbi:MAG: DNA translocase FtsK 4TM domain-containing protein [Clostridium sp.]|nr:DNA translocase FtsK 4TM domain-containing protein [Clostridium sp.]
MRGCFVAARNRKTQEPEQGRKNTGTGSARQNTGTRSSKRPAEVYEEEPDYDGGTLGTEVGIIVTFAVCTLLFLSNFGLIGAFGGFLSKIMLGLFGVFGYLVPVLIFAGMCFYASNRGNTRAVIKLAAGVVVLFSLCGLAQLFVGAEAGRTMGEYYAAAGGGGVIGGFLSSALKGMVGSVGAFFILLVILAIGAVCITEKSLVGFVRRSSDRAYEYAKEDVSRRRIQHAEKVEERKRLRAEQVVRGVDIAGTELKEETLKHSFSNIGKVTVKAGDLPAPEEKEDPEKEAAVKAAAPAEDKKTETAEKAEKPAAAEAVKPEPKLVFRVEEVEKTPENEPGDAAKELGPDSADIFQGQIHYGGRPRILPDTPAESDGEPELYARESREENSLLRSIYVRNDTMTLEELTGDAPAVRRAPEPAPAAPAVQAKPQQPAPAAQTGTPEPAREEIRKPVIELVREPEPEEVKETVWEPEPEEVPVQEKVRRPAAQEEETFRNMPFSSISVQVPDEISADSVEDLGDLDDEEDIYDDTPLPTAADIAAAVPDRSRKPAETAAPVVTASGKILSSDPGMTSALLERKRAEQRYAERHEAADPEPARIIEEKKAEPPKEYIFPPIDLLTPDRNSGDVINEDEFRETAVKLQQTLKNFGVGVTVTDISCGPTVTRYELQPDQGVKVSRILSLADDIKLNLAAADIRIEAPIPGKAAIGIEVPNKDVQTVFLRSLLESEEFRRHKSRLAFAVGKDIGGQTVVTDIAKMPHLLIAGATGSGKSVCINTLIMSVIYKAKPDEVKLIMIDPKVVELSVYNGIPHLLIPVVTDPKKAAGALNWAVAEMTERYRKFAEYRVRDLKGYNARVDEIADIDDPDKPEKMPQIIIIVDELADLMMVAPQDVEDAICRLAQLARAAGIHLIIATQRPSVNVITGIIKANIPSRIAFSVSSGVDSRTILDMVGAEKLLGKGDMLFYPSGYPKPKRVQGAFVSDEEVSNVVRFLTDQGLTADYSADIESRISDGSSGANSGGGDGGSDRDDYFEQAGRFIIEKDKASIGMLQRMFKIGFNRAARIMDQLAEAGVVGGEEGTKPRQILMTMDEFEALLSSGRM